MAPARKINPYEWLKVELSRPGRSQSDLARRLGLNPSAINRLVNGKRELKARELQLVEEYLADTIPSTEIVDKWVQNVQASAAPTFEALEILSPMFRGARQPEFQEVYEAIAAGDDASFITSLDQMVQASAWVYVSQSVGRIERLTPKAFDALQKIPVKFLPLGAWIEIAASLGEMPAELMNGLRRFNLVACLFRDPAQTLSLGQLVHDTFAEDANAIAARGRDGAYLYLFALFIDAQNHFFLGVEAAKAKTQSLEAYAERSRNMMKDREDST